MPRASKRRLKHTEHTHSFHELAFLLEGECNWHVGSRLIRVHPGELLLVPAGEKHYEITPGREQARIGWIGFSFADADHPVPDFLRQPFSSGDYVHELKRLFDAVCDEHQGEAAGHIERAELALREILILICRLAPSGTAVKEKAATQPVRGAQLVRSAALTLTGNLAQPMRIRDLANYHSLSASHFALLFRQHQGETPRRFLQKARIERAKVLLSEDALNVKEIAAACGYVDAAHLCHAFKSATGVTPKAFRQRRQTGAT